MLIWCAMPEIACSPTSDPMVLVSVARAAAVRYSLLNWLASAHTISPNTAPQIRAPRISPRTMTPADARPGKRPAGTGRRMLTVSTDMAHLLHCGAGLGAVLGEE